jgi:predicted nucleotidyltransferase
MLRPYKHIYYEEYMSKNQQEIQQNFVRLGKLFSENLLSEYDDILAIYIYGSVGRGEATPHSDLDVHVVLDRIMTPSHEDRTIEGITVGISYHSRFMYTTDLQAWIQTPGNLEKAAKSEGLWELADALPIYDPKGLIPKTQTAVATIRQNPEVIQLRTQLSLNQAWQMLSEVNQALSQDRLVYAYACLYHLTGGDGTPGVIPLLAKTIIRRAGLSLTTRRYIFRAYQACKELDLLELYTDILRLLGIKESSFAYASIVKERFLTAYDCAKSTFESRIAVNTPIPSQSTSIISEKTRTFFIDNYDDICEYASVDAAIGLAVGFSTRLLVDDNFSKASWLRTASEADAHRLLMTTAEIAGIEGDIHSALAEKSKCVENWLKTFASY